MPSNIFDVINAIGILRDRYEPTTAADIAADLATTRADVMPALLAALRDGLVDTRPCPGGDREWVLTSVAEDTVAAIPVGQP